MASIDVVDSICIRAPAAEVFKVVADYPAIAQWFPVYHCEIEGEGAIAPGSIVAHRYGRPPFVLSRFRRRVERIVPGECLEESYIDGDLRGKGVWRFAEQDGVTTASYHCQVSAQSWFARLGFRLQGSRAHSAVYEKLLVALKARCEAGDEWSGV